MEINKKKTETVNPGEIGLTSDLVKLCCCYFRLDPVSQMNLVIIFCMPYIGSMFVFHCVGPQNGLGKRKVRASNELVP